MTNAAHPDLVAAWRRQIDKHDLEAEETAELLARGDRWLPSLSTGLSVYTASASAQEAEALYEQVVGIMDRAIAGRRPSLRALDRARVLRPDWFQGPEQVGYVCYADRFAGTLTGVGQHLDYLAELGVTYLHLMPLLQPRPGADDGGYAVADYRTVRPDLGTMSDLATLADDLHTRGMSLTLDLVLNHVAREHAWAQAAIRAEEPYRRFFHVFADRTQPDAYERSLPEVFPDFAPGNFSWVPEFRLTPETTVSDPPTGAWVWTTFNDYQWDLNWANPDVFCAMLEVITHLANVGVDCLRLDAIAFIVKRMGTSCQGEPEVHAIVQALRAAVRIAAPGVIFKAEAIVAPEQLPAYLGTGPYAGEVSDLAYHNSLMVQLWSSIASGNARLARHALGVPGPKPTTTAWCTYVRCHDDIGWAISDQDAASIGISGWSHRRFLADFYAGRFPGSFARGADFQVNEATGDIRTTGTLASLAGVEAGVASGAAHDLDLSLGRVFLLHAVCFGYGGIPLIYMGDELGLTNDWAYLNEPAHAEDSRWVHRPVMDWQRAARRNDPTSVPGRIFSGLRHLAAVRATLPGLHAATAAEPLDVANDAVLALSRRHPGGSVVQLYNVTPNWQRVPARAVLDGARTHEHLSAFDPQPEYDGHYALPPYASWWLTV